MEVHVVVEPLQLTVTVVNAGATPGWQQTALITVSLSGHVLHEKLVGIFALTVTTATLAPALAAFLRELFVYHARANSVIPKRISINKESINAVSINV
jgi:hypothetical protein